MDQSSMNLKITFDKQCKVQTNNILFSLNGRQQPIASMNHIIEVNVFGVSSSFEAVSTKKPKLNLFGQTISYKISTSKHEPNHTLFGRSTTNKPFWGPESIEIPQRKNIFGKKSKPDQPLNCFKQPTNNKPLPKSIEILPRMNVFGKIHKSKPDQPLNCFKQPTTYKAPKSEPEPMPNFSGQSETYQFPPWENIFEKSQTYQPLKFAEQSSLSKAPYNDSQFKSLQSGQFYGYNQSHIFEHNKQATSMFIPNLKSHTNAKTYQNIFSSRSQPDLPKNMVGKQLQQRNTNLFSQVNQKSISKQSKNLSIFGKNEAEVEIKTSLKNSFDFNDRKTWDPVKKIDFSQLFQNQPK